MSEAVEVREAPGFLVVTIDFLAGVTVKSLESGGIILTERATLSLFLNERVRIDQRL